MRKWNGSSIASFCLEMSLSLKAGIAINESVYMLYTDEEEKEKKEVLNKIYFSVDKGNPIFEAMREAKCFPRYLVDMIEIGTKTGKLEVVFLALSKYYVRQGQINSALKNALIYPFVLMIMLLSVVLILVTKVLPIFSAVFEQLGASMSPVAVTMMNVGVGITKYSAGILAIILAIVLISILIYSIPSFKVRFGTIADKISFKSKLGKKIGTARFASALALTLSAGFEVFEALNMIERITESPVMLAKIKKCKQSLESGDTFAEAASQAELFSSKYCRMLSVGLKTGNVEAVLDEIVSGTEMEVDERIALFVNRIEPALVIIMSVIVGVILLSVMLPLMSIMTSIG